MDRSSDRHLIWYIGVAKRSSLNFLDTYTVLLIFRIVDQISQQKGLYV